MDLIDRYLAAVRRNLPAAKADDIIAELRDDLISRREDREESLGRPLSEGETGALLQESGHPLLVASRYRQHQYLIGPETFPFYLATMRVVLLIVGAVVVAVALAGTLFGGEPPLRAFAEAVSGLWMAVLANVAILTIVFALLERKGFAAERVMKWVPDQLPDLAQKQPGPWESAFEVALGIAFLLWWTGAIHLPYATGGRDFRIEAAPIFAQLYWPILLLAAARLVHNLIQWLRPRWTLLRGVTGVATAIGGLAILALVYQAGHWATVVSTGMAPAEAAHLQESLDLALKIAIVVCGVVWTLACLGELWRLARPAARRA